MSDLAFVIHSFALRMASRSTASEGSPLEIASPSLINRSTSPICHAGREVRHWKDGERDDLIKFYSRSGSVRLGMLLFNLVTCVRVRSIIMLAECATLDGTTQLDLRIIHSDAMLVYSENELA